MPLEAISVLMRRACRGGYALGYFESWNLESLQGVIDAAEQTRSPIIIGFNGGFLSGRDDGAPRTAGLVRGAGPGGRRVGLGPLRPDLQRMPLGRLGPPGHRRRLQPGHAGRPGAPFDRSSPGSRAADPVRPRARGRRRGRGRRAPRRHRRAWIEGRIPDRPDSGGPVRRGHRGRPPGRQRRQCPCQARRHAGSRPRPARRDPPPRRDPAGSPRRDGNLGRLACARPSIWAWPRSTTALTSSSAICGPSARRSIGDRSIRTGSWGWAGQRICSSPAAWRSATRCSSGSSFWAAADGRTMRR